jgi:hypothetical protein
MRTTKGRMLFLSLIHITVTIMIAGCAPSYYVDPKFSRIPLSSIAPVSSSRPVDLVVRWQTNGSNTILPPNIRETVAAALQSTHVFPIVTPGGTDNADKIDILIDNHGDRTQTFAGIVNAPKGNGVMPGPPHQMSSAYT